MATVRADGGDVPSDVVMVHWPREEGRRAELRRRGIARLLLVDHVSPAPEVVEPLEDWIRVPAPEADVQARLATLSQRAAASNEATPTLDRDGVLRFRNQWVALAPLEARLVAALLDRRGAVVSRQILNRAGWPDEGPNRNVLDVKIFRLRRRIEPLGLTIRTVRSRGYLLETQPNVDT